MESLAPPGLAPVAVSATMPSAPVNLSRWLALGGMLTNGGSGLRAELDLYRRGRWLVGAAGSIADTESSLSMSTGNGDMVTRDFKAIAYVTRPALTGRWQLRPTLGVGLIYSKGLAYDGSTFYPLEGTFPTLEASLVVTRDVGTQWGAYAGPLATLIVQEYTAMPGSSAYPMTIQRGGLDVALFAGVRRRL